MERKVSRYTKQLQELGFTRVSPEIEAYVKQRSLQRMEMLGVADHQLTRKERRAAQKLRTQPGFTVFHGEAGVCTTFVTDEADGMWVTTTNPPPFEALESLGFKNCAQYVPLAATFPPLGPLKRNS